MLERLDRDVPRLIVGLPVVPSGFMILSPAPTDKDVSMTVFMPVLTCIPLPLELNDGTAPVILI
jgi:hypothetical protein